MPLAYSNLISRQVVCDGFGYCYSGWYFYGRWILLGVVILAALLCFMSTCLRSRRRVTQGKAPIYGTAWALPNYHQSQNQYGFNQPAPPYANAPPDNAGYYNTDGTYNNMYVPPPVPGQQQQGVVNNDFAPPPGPPPSHLRTETEQSQSNNMPEYMPPSHPPPAMTKNY